MNAVWPGLQMLVCAASIAAAGFVLSRSADALADAHGWGRGWVGLALLATITSLPELASGISAVALVDAPDLAVGNALGACVVNLAFLVVVDLLQHRQPMYRHASTGHLLSAGFGVVMLGFVTMSLVIGRGAPQLPVVGLYSPVLLGLYLLALRSVFTHERSSRQTNVTAAAATRHVDRGCEWRRFAISSLVVLVAGTWLPHVAEDLSEAAGLSHGVVGTVFMAIVTTLPEMAVTLSALRLGALDLAIGNLLGSNLFNVLILAVDDVAYLRGPLLAHATSGHAGTAATALVMTGLVIVGLVMRPQGRVLRRASWISVGLVAACVIHAALLALAQT